MPGVVPFRFVCCQIGAEKALKDEFRRLCPAWRFAFSRPGFVTFKDPTRCDPVDADAADLASTAVTPGENLAESISVDSGMSVKLAESPRKSSDLPLLDPVVRRSVFARSIGFSGGKVSGSDLGVLATEAVRLLPVGIEFHDLHVWQRDTQVPGTRGFEPFPTPAAQEAAEAISTAYCREREPLVPPAVNSRAPHHAWVADIVLVEPDQWWIGWHQVTTISTSWPGGVPPLPPKDRTTIVSRAYWKMLEGLAWSRLPIRKGDPCIELGSSPGGACQALLEKDLVVLGIDPAVMDPRVMAHPNFHHIRAKAADLKRREFAGVPWLFMDANVAPQYTLDAVEAIVTNRRVHTKGMLLTMKLTDWDLAQQIDTYLERIASWGFRYVRARQLAFNKQEICVVALRKKHLLRTV